MYNLETLATFCIGTIFGMAIMLFFMWLCFKNSNNE